MVLGKVKLPVFIEVTGGAKRPQAKDCLGAGQGPSGSRAVHAVFHKVAARALDHAGGDGEPIAEGGLVMHQSRARAVRQVFAGDVDGLAGLVVQVLRARLPPANRAGDVSAASSAEKREKAIADPALRLRVARAEQRTRSVPDVFEDVHHVDEDRRLDTGAPSLLLHGRQLLGIAVHQDDPSTYS